MSDAAGARMAFWLAETLLEQRKRAGLGQTEIAQTLGVSPRTIDRLERGESMGRDIDQYLAGYAYALGMDDPRELWEMAVRAYRRHGSPPQFTATSEATAAFAEAIRRTALRRRQGNAAPSETNDANPSRRASG